MDDNRFTSFSIKNIRGDLGDTQLCAVFNLASPDTIYEAKEPGLPRDQAKQVASWALAEPDLAVVVARSQFSHHYLGYNDRKLAEQALKELRDAKERARHRPKV